MSVHIRGILLLGEEAESSDDTNWDDEDELGLTDQDCEIMASIGCSAMLEEMTHERTY
jgi:hypothetical protein